MKITLAIRITKAMLVTLKKNITAHHELLINTYSVDLTPKDHFLLHYPRVIEKMGPPKIQWTMRNESKNGFLKSLAEKIKNFIDIAYTLSDRHQKAMLSFWNDDADLFTCKPVLLSAKNKTLESLAYKQIILEHFPVLKESIISVGKSVEFRGTELILNKFICSSFFNNLLVFGKTLLFFSFQSQIFVICELWKTLGVSPSCLGYLVVPTSMTVILEINDLPYTKSWEIYEICSEELVIITDYFL